jgi:hypothetical protein
MGHAQAALERSVHDADGQDIGRGHDSGRRIVEGHQAMHWSAP